MVGPEQILAPLCSRRFTKLWVHKSRSEFISKKVSTKLLYVFECKFIVKKFYKPAWKFLAQMRFTLFETGAMPQIFGSVPIHCLNALNGSTDFQIAWCFYSWWTFYQRLADSVQLLSITWRQVGKSYWGMTPPILLPSYLLWLTIVIYRNPYITKYKVI